MRGRSSFALLVGGIAVVSLVSFVAAQEKTRPEVKLRPEVKHEAKGAQVQELKGRDAGRPLSALPGVKTITFEEWSKLKDIPKTGLFLVDMDYVPHGLEKRLEREGLRLKPDGSLVDKKGNPVTLFHREEKFKVQRDKKSETDGGRFGWLGPVIGEAHAASPHPFACWSWSWSARYRGGFCRDYRAWTSADAWGPDAGGGCGETPHTNIQFIETRAGVAGHGTDVDTCSNCYSRNSYKRWDIGCWWPAHGTTWTSHFANLKDGAINIIVSATW